MVKLGLKALKKHDHVLFGSPTGSGKSIMMLDIVSKSLANGERVLVILPYRKLVFQIMDTFKNYSPALVMGTDSYGDPKTSPIVIASLTTLSRRLKTNPMLIGGLDLIVIDEAHIAFNMPDDSPSKITTTLHKLYWNTTKFLGFTATPITASGFRLEGWDHSIYKYSTGWLIKHGWLAEFDYYSVPDIDIEGLRVNSFTGEYSTADIEERTNNASAIRAVLKNYKKYGKGKKCLIFGASIDHAELIHKKFQKKGINTRTIHSNLSEKEQQKILEEYKNNVFEVLINVAMLTTGFDDPEVEVLFIARPVGSKRLAIQINGRALRTHKDIPKVKIVDLCSVYLKCGLPDDKHNWNKEKPKKGIKDDSEESPSIEEVILECRSCSNVFRMVDAKRNTKMSKSFVEIEYICPICNEIADVKIKPLEDSKAVKIKTGSDIDNKKYSLVDIKQLLGELIKQNTGAKPSWGHFIHRTCVTSDSKDVYEQAYKGYDQGVYTGKQAWKRIMDVYNA